jgi:hypothetical protein
MRAATYPFRRWPRLTLGGLSRLKAVADVTLETPALAGPKIPIATADSRESWGPAPPPGTPPAGSPGR